MIAEIILVPSPDLQPAPFSHPRKLASDVGINRETVRCYLRLRKPAISIAGSEEGADRKPAISFTGKQAGDTQSKPAIPIAGVGAGAGVGANAWLKWLGTKLEVGLSARRIYQDLVEQNDFRDGACSKALKAGTYRFKDLRRLLGGKRHA
jgi:hypothetical protein